MNSAISLHCYLHLKAKLLIVYTIFKLTEQEDFFSVLIRLCRNVLCPANIPHFKNDLLFHVQQVWQQSLSVFTCWRKIHFSFDKQHYSCFGQRLNVCLLLATFKTVKAIFTVQHGYLAGLIGTENAPPNIVISSHNSC